MDEHMKRRLDKQKKLFRQLGIQLDALSIHEKNFSNKLRVMIRRKWIPFWTK